MLTYHENKSVGDISTQHTFRVEQRKSSMTLKQCWRCTKGQGNSRFQQMLADVHQ